MTATALKTIRFALFVIALAGASAGPAASRSLVAAPAAVTVDSCSWDRPGQNPFMGDVVGAVDRYQDIPADVRERLKARMAAREYDDLVSIRRDSITGNGTYGNAINDMHFGTNQVCRSVTRSAWSPQMQERGLVYCESGHCILVPTVCRNVSRIARAEVEHERATGPAEPEPAIAGVPPDEEPLYHPVYEPPIPLATVDGPPSFSNASSWPGPFGGPLFSAPGGGGGFGSPVLASRSALTSTSTPTSLSSLVDAPFPISAAPPFEIAPIPEPGTWASMLLGLAGFGLLQRRRKRVRRD